MDNTENEIMEYATNAVVVLNGSYSNSQDNLSSMGCDEKFQEFEGKFNMLDTNYQKILDKGEAYDNEANQTNNVKNNNLISDKHKSISSKKILSDAFANIQKDEIQVFSDIEKMKRINNENNKETENADNSIWSMIGKSLDNLFTNLVGGLVPSAKAESALNLCGTLLPLNENILKTIWGDNCIVNGIFYNIIDDELYEYDLSNGQLKLPNGNIVVVPGSITEGYINIPPRSELVNPQDATSYLKAADRLRIVMLLAGYEDKSVLDDSFVLSNYGSTDEMLILAPEKPADTVYNQDDLLLIGKFFQHSLRANVASQDEFGKLDCYAHSNSVGTLGKVLSKDSNDYFNGKVVFYDYAPIKSGDGRGQKVDQYTDDDITKIKEHQSRNKQQIVIYDAGGGNSSYINTFNNAICDSELCLVIPYNATNDKKTVGHGKIYFQDLLRDNLNLYKQ